MSAIRMHPPVGGTPSAPLGAAELSTRDRGSHGLVRRARRVLWGAGWPARAILLGLIRAYQATLSGVLGGQCRFDPTCSAYAAGAIRSRGAIKGTGLAVWRVLRCNPFGRGGRDPAPASPGAYENVIQGPAS